MRTTLDIDDDVLAAARERARREGRSMGSVLSELARKALLGDAESQPATRPRHGFQPFPARGPIVTNEAIDALREEEGV